jgi:hypothetical protein
MLKTAAWQSAAVRIISCYISLLTAKRKTVNEVGIVLSRSPE